MKCSFCEAPLTCKACSRPFRPRGAETLLAAYQSDMRVVCPECQQPLVCKSCGFVYGEREEEDEDG